MFEMTPLDRRMRRYMVENNPFVDVRDIEKIIDRTNLRDLESRMFDPAELSAFKTDIKETDDGYVLEADLPGFKKEDIKIDVDGDAITIKATRKTESDEEDADGRYVKRERSYGSYTRTFDASEINTDALKAQYTDGVLKLTMPKKQESETASKTISID